MTATPRHRRPDWPFLLAAGGASATLTFGLAAAGLFALDLLGVEDGLREVIPGAWVILPGAALLGAPLALRLRRLEARFAARVRGGAGRGALLGVANIPFTILFMGIELGYGSQLGELAGFVAWGTGYSLANCTVLPAAAGGAYVGALLGALAHWWPEKRKEDHP